jgi:hypothetical protein
MRKAPRIYSRLPRQNLVRIAKVRQRLAGPGGEEEFFGEQISRLRPTLRDAH